MRACVCVGVRASYVCTYVRACVRGMCLRMYVRAYVRACVRLCVRRMFARTYVRVCDTTITTQEDQEDQEDQEVRSTSPSPQRAWTPEGVRVGGLPVSRPPARRAGVPQRGGGPFRVSTGRPG